jgi:DNA-binding NarL/FixJ family response regulator
MNGVIRVFLVSGNEAMREELRQMVSSEEGVIVAGEGALADAKESSPDVILMLADERMPGMNVIDTTRAISETQLPAKVIIIAANTDQYLVSAIKAGAAGILPRNISRDELLSAIRKIHLWSPSSSSSR